MEIIEGYRGRAGSGDAAPPCGECGGGRRLRILLLCTYTHTRAKTDRYTPFSRRGITVSPAARTLQCCQPGSGGLATVRRGRRPTVSTATTTRHTAYQDGRGEGRLRRLVAARRRPTRSSTAGYRNFDKTANVTTTNGRFSVPWPSSRTDARSTKVLPRKYHRAFVRALPGSRSTGDVLLFDIYPCRRPFSNLRHILTVFQGILRVNWSNF